MAATPPSSTTPQASAGQKGSGSYGEILKSSAWVGASSVLTIAVGIVRAKALALLLGPAGVGLVGLYSSVLDVARSLAQMGTNSSGVRQIAEAVGTGDQQRIAVTSTVLARLVGWLGVAGALMMLAGAPWISRWTFGDDQHTGAIGLLSLALLLRVVADGQVALLQGMRRMADLAKLAAWGALIGTVACVALVYVWREDGIVMSLVAMSAAALGATWWYRRRLPLAAPLALPRSAFASESRALLKLGAAFLISGLLMMGAALAVRSIVLRSAGLEAAGLYQAAWTVGGMYVSLVLQAMGTDFYPRLVGAIQDHGKANQLVNEQAQVSLLMAAPGVIATLAFAPAVMTLLYSEAFTAGTEILRWLCLGMALRVITWPIGYIIVARNSQPVYIATEVAWTVVHLALAWWFVQAYGAAGAGMAFAASYVFHGVMIYPIVRRMTGFRWSGDNLRTGSLFVLAISAVFLLVQWLPVLPGLAVGALATLLSAVVSVRKLTRLLPASRLPRALQWLLKPLGSRAPSEVALSPTPATAAAVREPHP